MIFFSLKQIEAQEAAVQDFLHESSKPLARYKDDRDLETKLKDIEREGDPMLKYIKDKKRERGELGPGKNIFFQAVSRIYQGRQKEPSV